MHSLEQFVRESPVAVAMFDREMRYLAASRVWVESYRLDVEELRGLSHYEVFPEIPEHWKAVHRRGLAGEVIREDEEAFVRLDGTVQWLQWEVRPWRDKDGQVAGVVIYTEDISERKEAEESLREREERLTLAMEAARQAPWEIDLANDAVVASPALYALFGLPEHQGSTDRADWRSHVLPADRPTIADAIRQAGMSDGHYTVQYRIRRPSDGRVRWISAVGTMRRDEAGRPTRLVGVAMDITERKRAEAAQARLAAIVESSDDAIVSVDASGTVETWNQGAERLFGYTAAEIVGQPVERLVPPDRLDEEAAILSKVQAGQHVEHLETVRLCRDGRRVDVSLTISPLRDEAGRILGASKIVRDITARKRGEQALRESEERLRLLGDNLPDSAVYQYAYDPDGTARFLYLSAGVERLNGVPADEILRDATALHRRVPPPHDRLLRDAEAQSARDLTDFDLEVPVVRPDGELRWMRLHSRPRRQVDGRVVWDGVQTDVTAQRCAQEELRRSRDTLRAILDAAPAGIVVSGTQGNVLLASAAAERLFGGPVAPEAGSAERRYSLCAPDGQPIPRERLPLTRALAGERVADVELLVKRADGTEAVIVAHATPLRGGDGSTWGAVMVFQDITRRKRAEEVVQAADRRKDEFLAILSHELRNPLAPIRYALPVVQRETLGPVAARALAVIDRQVAHLTRLVDDLLDISRITSDKIELRRELVTLATVVNTAIEAASPAIAAARHTLRPVVPDEPVWLHADPARLSQVVTNLLNNSAKYTPRGGEIVLEAAREGGQAVIRVRDSGVGLSGESLSTVFEMFRQVPHADKPQGGLGIGLALAKRLVEMHGGSIEARSEGVARGAEFTVKLPLVAPPGTTGEGEARPRPAAGRRLKVLVVDDNADLVEMLSLLVEQAGHDVRKALDGQSALAAASAYRPDLVLLDLGLPVMSGLDVARELRRRPETAGARLVALTGWGQPHDRERTRAAGFDRHLTKPTDAETLAALLNEYAQGDV